MIKKDYFSTFGQAWRSVIDHLPYLTEPETIAFLSKRQYKYLDELF